jgi:hypothetical protein
MLQPISNGHRKINMKIKTAVFSAAMILFVPFSVFSADEDISPADVGSAPGVAEESPVDFLENGTLYSNTIHHRRPARAIAETWETRKKKSLLENVSASVTSNFRSKYVSHALADSLGWVWQPSATIEWYGLGFNAWGNFVLDDEADQGTFNEIDLTLYYDIKIYGFTIHPYFAAYLYPTDNKRSLDYSASTDLLPSIQVAYSAGPVDIFADVEVYAHPNPGAVRAEFGIGVTEKLPLKFGIETSGLVGFDNSRYNKATFNISDTTFDYFTYSIAFPWNPIKGFVVKPNAYVSAYFQQKFRNATPYPVLMWGGVDFAYNF